MRISRFFYNDVISVDDELTLPPELSHYLVSVLRVKLGQPVILFNGNGSDYPSEVTEIHKKHCKVLVNSQLSLNVESPLELHLAQGVSKGDRMDYAIQKAVELGVTAITPVITHNCNVKLSEERWAKKVEQWQKIAVSACEQSQRNIVPTVHAPLSFSQLVAKQTDLTKLMLAPGSATYLSGLKKPARGFMLSIGPEGGFTEQEVYTAEQCGFILTNLGPRILRTETATAVGLSVLQSLFGDL
ncbi:16S rRNA (uracil(1498)-N(3))-methyltransferase [Agaribacter flavus]|uniref:Ribosomal RNA small subunit methyltransferase E n=1 Tax=Agaribacter flavus TaxID=1902781 RepID=A0ABV7FL02_9ALTE